ncbi:MAG TPA: hypothetical protein VHV27_02330 [Phenylobacterium sp.]|nr:hypothetical protein [Phenylobacterium sp.]
MKYEVIEAGGEWIVSRDGHGEVARFSEQAKALEHIGQRLRDAQPSQDAASLRVRYQARG